MSHSLGRGGRRRRVLNEEMVAASGTHAVPDSKQKEDVRMPATTYGEAAASSNHARLSDLIPRHCGTIWLGCLAGLVCTAGLAAIQYYQPQIFGLAGVPESQAFYMQDAGSLARWLCSATLLLTAGCCLFIFSLRRHKLDDYRGRYRVWFVAALATLLLSVNSITQLHTSIALAAAQLTGWSALPNDAVWWLAPATIVFGWLGLRTLADLWASRLARAAGLATIAFAGIALAFHFLVPQPVLQLPANVTALFLPVATLIACQLLLMASVAFARYVILEADGLLDTKTKSAEVKSAETTPASAKNNTTVQTQPRQVQKKAPVVATTANNRSEVKAATNSRAAKKEEIEWTDGSTPDPQYNEHSGEPRKRKLSKSERKRLRALKAKQRRAA